MSADSTAARAAHILHERPTDPALILDLLTSATARIDAEAPGPQALVVVPDAEAALAVAALAPDVPAARGLVPVTSVKRATRLLGGGPLAIVGGVADLVELLRRSVLKLEQVRHVLVLEAERLDAEAELAMLDALLAELPKDAARVVVAATVTPAVQDLAERHLYRARRMSGPAPAAAAGSTLHVLTTAVTARAAAFGLMLDDLDPPSVAIIAERPADRAAAEEAVARLGLSRALATVVGADGPVPEHVAAAVLWGVPSAKALAAVTAAQPARVVALVSPRDRRAVAAVAAGAVLTPYVPADAARAVRAADARLRASLRDELARGTPLRELAALEPLFDQHDPADVAAAAVRLLDATRARLAAALAAPVVVPAPSAPAVRDDAPAPRSDDRSGERRGPRSGPGGSRGGPRSADRGDRGSDRAGARGGDRGAPRGGDRPRGARDGGAPFRGGAKGGPRSGGAGKREGGMREGPKGFGRGRPPRGPEEGGPRKEWQERGERLRNASRRRDG